MVLSDSMTTEELSTKIYVEIKKIREDVNETIEEKRDKLRSPIILAIPIAIPLFIFVICWAPKIREIFGLLEILVILGVLSLFFVKCRVTKIIRERFGTLGILTILSFCCVIYWASKIRELYFSLFLGFIVLMIQIWLIGKKKFDVTSRCLGCISIIYGVICFNSCLLGFSIGKEFFCRLEFLKSCLVFVSVAVAIYILLIGNTHDLIKKGLDLEQSGADSFTLAFISLVLAISFFYVILGIESRNEGVLVFMISACLSFLTGFALSILILQFSRMLNSFHNHWFFVCILTVFISNLCVVITRQDMTVTISTLFKPNMTVTISTLAKKVIEFLLGKNVFEWMLTFI